MIPAASWWPWLGSSPAASALTRMEAERLCSIFGEMLSERRASLLVSWMTSSDSLFLCEMQILTCSQFCPVVVRNALAWRIPNDGVFLIKLRLPPSQWWPFFLRMRLTGSRARPVQVKRAIGWLPVISSGLKSDWLRLMALGGRRLWRRC